MRSKLCLIIIIIIIIAPHILAKKSEWGTLLYCEPELKCVVSVDCIPLLISLYLFYKVAVGLVTKVIAFILCVFARA